MEMHKMPKRTIVLDMEWTNAAVKGKFTQNVRRDKMHNEIIQIGAVVIDEHCQIAEKFLVNVCPIISGEVKKDIQKLTGLTYEYLKKNGRKFKSALEAFKAFVGDGPARILTWDEADEVVLDENMLFWNTKYENKPEFIDLQTVCGQMLFPCEGRKSVEKSMEDLRLEPVGQFHNALDDAMNEVRIFQTIPNALSVLDTYDPYYFICENHQELPSFRVYSDMTEAELVDLLDQDVISAVKLDDTYEVLIPRFLYKKRYIKVWKCLDGFVAEYVKSTKNKNRIYAYARLVTEEEVARIKKWYIKESIFIATRINCQRREAYENI